MKASQAIVTGVLLLIGLELFSAGCRRKVEDSRDKYASGGEMRSPLQNMFTHLNEDHYLTVNGKTYKHVRGVKPFYLEIPQLHSILFVTGRVDQSATFHLVNTESKHELTIQGGPVGFGWDIGAPRKQGEPFTEYVLSATSNEVSLVKQYTAGRDTVVLRLDSKKVDVR